MYAPLSANPDMLHCHNHEYKWCSSSRLIILSRIRENMCMWVFHLPSSGTWFDLGRWTTVFHPWLWWCHVSGLAEGGWMHTPDQSCTRTYQTSIPASHSQSKSDLTCLAFSFLQCWTVSWTAACDWVIVLLKLCLLLHLPWPQEGGQWRQDCCEGPASGHACRSYYTVYTSFPCLTIIFIYVLDPNSECNIGTTWIFVKSAIYFLKYTHKHTYIENSKLCISF